MLTLPIKGKWLNMICSGEKGEEYRAITSRYKTMFKNAAERANAGGKFWVRLRNGYRLDSPSILALVSCHVGPGRPEWGAEAGVDYHVLTIHQLADDIGNH